MKTQKLGNYNPEKMHGIREEVVLWDYSQKWGVKRELKYIENRPLILETGKEVEPADKSWIRKKFLEKGSDTFGTNDQFVN